ncbi:MAG: hypothetical protein OWU33_05180 [Firmicutes bacterium]|nr:hypothetical protein [Bacillota bacterium]
MAAGNFTSWVHVLLSLALVSSGGGHEWQHGSCGFSVAQLQAELGVLGYDAGPVTGVMNARTINAAASFEADFGPSGGPLSSRLAQLLTRMRPFHNRLEGPLVLAMESDLHQLGLYRGPYRSEESPSLRDGLNQFAEELNMTPSTTISGPMLLTLAHATAVRVTAEHHWAYRAQPGDTLSFLAWAAGLPLSGFERANPSPSNRVQVGQPIVWKAVPPKVVPPPRSSPQQPMSHSQSPTSTASATGVPPITGVLANLDPVSDLVVMNPTDAELLALIQAEKARWEVVDISVTGAWALTHPGLIARLKALGNEIAVNGYTGTNLNELPSWGVSQELSWAKRAVASAAGSDPGYLVMTQRANALVSQVATRDNLIVMNPSAIITPARTPRLTTKALVSALLTHPNQIVLLDAPVVWPLLFRDLAHHHFVFETLGQVWASQ